jgi:cell division inhibitor SepF
MTASETFRRARGRLAAALDRDRGGDREDAWEEEDVEYEAYEERPELRLVEARRHEIGVVSVAEFEDVRRVADLFRREAPVVVDLQGCGPDVARRVTDFCSGLAYARDGALRPVADHLIMLAPGHVDLSGGGRSGLGGSGFYNQL